jgi:hypothetical protein
MGTGNKDLQKKGKEKQATKGKKPIAGLVSSHVKDLIDKEKKGTGSNIGSIIERAVINYVDPVAGDSTSHKGIVIGTPPQQMPTEDIQKIVDDLKDIVYRIEKIATVEADVARNEAAATSENIED